MTGGNLTTVWSGPRLDKGLEWQQSKAKERLYAWNFTPAGGLSHSKSDKLEFVLNSFNKQTEMNWGKRTAKIYKTDTLGFQSSRWQVSQVFLPLQRTKRHFSSIAGAQKWQKSTGVSQSFGKTDKRIGWIEQRAVSTSGLQLQGQVDIKVPLGGENLRAKLTWVPLGGDRGEFLQSPLGERHLQTRGGSDKSFQVKECGNGAAATAT